MEKLIVCRKKKMGMFFLACFVILVIVYIYPICFYNIYKLLFDNTYSFDRNLLDDLLVVLLAVPGLLPWCFIIKEYICILLDIKMKKKTTITVKGCGKPELQLFDTYKTGTEIKNDSYFYWKAKDNSDKRYRFIIFREENNLKGKTMKHSYNVTCYKYSKVVTNIEKI